MPYSLQSPSPASLIAKLQDAFDEQERLISKLEAENARLHSDRYKDEELAESARLCAEYKEAMLAARKDANRGFPISEEESEQIDEWIAAHESKVHGRKTVEERLAAGGAIGGGYAYRFIPTSIGVIGEVICSSCGESFCFQELE